MSDREPPPGTTTVVELVGVPNRPQWRPAPTGQPAPSPQPYRPFVAGRAAALRRALAFGEATTAELAERFNVAVSSINRFAHREAAAIDRLRSQADADFTALWIADKVARVAEYQEDAERLESAAMAGEVDAIKTRTAIFKAVAEEMGQLPPRVNVNVGNRVVTYQLVGVDPAQLA